MTIDEMKSELKFLHKNIPGRANTFNEIWEWNVRMCALQLIMMEHLLEVCDEKSD